MDALKTTDWQPILAARLAEIDEKIVAQQVARKHYQEQATICTAMLNALRSERARVAAFPSVGKPKAKVEPPDAEDLEDAGGGPQ